MDEEWNDSELSDDSNESTTKLRCLSPNYESQQYQDDGFETATSAEQAEIEENVKMCVQVLKAVIETDPRCPVLLRDAHLQFLKKGLCTLPTSLEVLDSSRPWLCYWILHSIELLAEDIPEEAKAPIIKFLSLCQHPDGGFGGGPGVDAHLAPTYASVNALCILRCEEAYKVIDRSKLLSFLFRMKNPDGSFKMHEGSESDIRGAYCALSVAMLTSTLCPELVKKTAHWVSRCQTYEGGFGGVPDMEAHGGYTFCGLASLVMLQEGHLINVHNLLRWLVNRQTRYEGGFQGRTNKLVDSCYSFWQGGSFPLIQRLLERTESENLSTESWLFHQKALQEYLLISCQAPHGGLIDKPGKMRDFYHTCYALSGLSVAQHFQSRKNRTSCVLGHEENNELDEVHPIYNICIPSAIEAIQFFHSQPFPELPDADSDES